LRHSARKKGVTKAMKNNMKERPAMPTGAEITAVTEELKTVVTKLRDKVLVEKKVTTKDFVDHADAIAAGYGRCLEIIDQLCGVIQWQGEEIARLCDKVSSLISGKRLK